MLAGGECALGVCKPARLPLPEAKELCFPALPTQKEDGTWCKPGENYGKETDESSRPSLKVEDLKDKRAGVFVATNVRSAKLVVRCSNIDCNRPRLIYATKMAIASREKIEETVKLIEGLDDWVCAEKIDFSAIHGDKASGELVMRDDLSCTVSWTVALLRTPP